MLDVVEQNRLDLSLELAVNRQSDGVARTSLTSRLDGYDFPQNVPRDFQDSVFAPQGTLHCLFNPEKPDYIVEAVPRLSQKRELLGRNRVDSSANMREHCPVVVHPHGLLNYVDSGEDCRPFSEFDNHVHRDVFR
jgi:hypothetical protein